MTHAPSQLWPPVFKAAIFDFDGTISSTANLWHEVDEAFLGSRGLPYDEEYPRMLSVLGFAGDARYTIERYGLSESVEAICDEWSRMGRALYETQATLRPGVREYILALRERGIPTALATTNGPEVLDAMQLVNVNELFDVRVHGVDVARAKDHPDIYLEAARRMAVPPEDCIVFEDIPVGIRSAKRAGMLTCGVRADDPVQKMDEIRQVADLVLDDWQDICL